MQSGYYMMGGGAFLKKYKLGAAQANAGIIMVGGVTTAVGLIPTGTTLASTTPAFGLAVDQGTYTATPTSTTEGIVTVDARPDLVIRALMTGAATENTALATLTQTSASTTVLTCTVQSNSIDGGTMWALKGANISQSRSITAHTSTTSLTVTVAMPNSMAVGDTFLACPWNMAGTGVDGADGNGWVQTSTLFTQADASIASGTGVVCSVVDLELNGATDSYVLFTLQGTCHAHGSNANAA